MMKEIVLMLVATMNVTPMTCEYLLVELQDTNTLQPVNLPNDRQVSYY